MRSSSWLRRSESSPPVKKKKSKKKKQKLCALVSREEGVLLGLDHAQGRAASPFRSFFFFFFSAWVIDSIIRRMYVHTYVHGARVPSLGPRS